MTHILLAVLNLRINVLLKISKGLYFIKQRLQFGSQFPDTFAYSVKQMQETVDKLSDAHTAAATGDSVAAAAEKVAEGEFDLVFGQYRDWTNQPEIAYNDELKIKQLGFEVSQEPTHAGEMPAPTLLPLTGQDEGQLNATSEKISKFRCIIWFVAYGEEMPTDDDYRYLTAGTSLRQVLKLRSGQVAWVRAIAVGPLGPGPMSAAVKRRVL